GCAGRRGLAERVRLGVPVMSGGGRPPPPDIVSLGRLQDASLVGECFVTPPSAASAEPPCSSSRADGGRRRGNREDGLAKTAGGRSPAEIRMKPLCGEAAGW